MRQIAQFNVGKNKKSVTQPLASDDKIRVVRMI